MSFGPDVPVVLAASASWDTPAPVNAHQVARRLAARGHRVLFVESTGLRAPAPAAARSDLRRVLGRLRGFVRGVREVAPGLFVLSPVALPGAGPRWLRRASLRAVGLQVARACRGLGVSRPVVWAFLPTALGLPEAVRARGLVYHCVDHYAANPGVDRPWIEALEAGLVGRADVVFATSPVLAERLRRSRPDVILEPNGADVALFSRAVREPLEEPTDLRELPRPRLVYVGNLAAYRIDFALLRGLARRLPAASLVLVGARGLGDVSGASEGERALLREPNVRALAARAQEVLPALLRHCDVGLVPFLDNEHTRGSLPLKLWEYLAAGLPVVARDLPVLSREAPGLVRTADDADGFAAAVEAALAEPAERREERLRCARERDWPERFARLVDAVERALDARAASSQGEGTPL